MVKAPLMVLEPTGDKRGHYAVFVSKLSHALAGRGRRVLVVTNKMDMTPYGGAPPGVEIVEACGGRLAFLEGGGAGLGAAIKYWYQYFRNSFAVTLTALKLARERAIRDIYITDCEFLMASILLLAVRDPKRRIFMQVNAANFAFSAYRGGLLKKAYKQFQTQFFKLALKLGRVHGINAMGTWHAERLARQLSLPAEFPICVIPDGADLGDGPSSRAEARRLLHLDERDVLALAFGNFRRDKDYRTLFGAFACVKNPALRLVLAGHPAEYSVEELNCMIDAAGIRDKIAWSRFDFSPTDLVKQLFSASDVLVLPYGVDYTDGCGPLRKESATFERPVIASDVAEMGRLIRGHDLGIAFQAGSPTALAEALDKFAAANTDQRAKWSHNCRELGRENSWEKMAERFEAFFDSVSGDRQLVHGNC